MATDMTAKTTYDFDQMLSSAREAYGEELMKMADEGLEFVFTYSDNVAASSATGKFVAKYPDRCFNLGIAEPNQVGASAGLALAGEIVFSQVFGPSFRCAADQIHTDIAYNDVNVSFNRYPLRCHRRRWSNPQRYRRPSAVSCHP